MFTSALRSLIALGLGALIATLHDCVIAVGMIATIGPERKMTVESEVTHLRGGTRRERAGGEELSSGGHMISPC